MAFLLNANTVLWLAAILSLALFIFSGVAAEVTTNRRRDTGMRLMRMLVCLLAPALAIFPALTAVWDESGGDLGPGLVFYVVFFSLFCYRFGKSVGNVQGRRHISDFIGLDSPNNIEDAQDRLFESRLRFPARAAVVKSIAEMAKAQEKEFLERERQSAGRKDGVADVPVEAVVNRDRPKSKKTRQ